jgi:hypothetical protein
MTMSDRAVRALALFAALQATFSDVHPFCDQIVQNSNDAKNKGLHGHYLVYADGVKVGEEAGDRTGQPAMTASKLGRICAGRHVATYSAGQLSAAVGVTRALGYRVSWSGLLAGTVINAATHYVIDRREPLKKFLRSNLIGKGGYLDHATVQRRERVVDEGGPGTALMECDQAAHRLISVVASLTTTWLALRTM